MPRDAKPLTGFGPVGWSLLPLLAALIWVASSGWDLRHFVLARVYYNLGWDAMLWVILQPLRYHSYGLTLPEPGLVWLTYVLVAFRLYPKSLGWRWYALVIAWALVRPLMEYWIPRELGFRWGGPNTGAGPRGTTFIGLTILETGGLMYLTRDRTTALGLFACAFWAVGGWLLVDRLTNVRPWMLIVLSAVWHSGLAVLLLRWGWHARRQLLRGDGCEACGYELAGLKSNICPECGNESGAWRGTMLEC